MIKLCSFWDWYWCFQIVSKMFPVSLEKREVDSLSFSNIFLEIVKHLVSSSNPYDSNTPMKTFLPRTSHFKLQQTSKIFELPCFICILCLLEVLCDVSWTIIWISFEYQIFYSIIFCRSFIIWALFSVIWYRQDFELSKKLVILYKQSS